MTRTPCPYCSARLPVRFDTDGNGKDVAHVEPCQCEGARWRRGVCVDCGRAVEWVNRKRLPKKRCPRHHRQRLIRQRSSWHREHPEYGAEWWRERRRDPRVRLRERAYSREYRKAERAVRRQGVDTERRVA